MGQPIPRIVFTTTSAIIIAFAVWRLLIPWLSAGWAESLALLSLSGSLSIVAVISLMRRRNLQRHVDSGEWGVDSGQWIAGKLHTKTE